MADGKFRVTTITLKPRVTLKPGEDAGKARELLAKAESNCLISNSVRSRVSVEPTIAVS